MSGEEIIRFCAPTLAGLKAGSLFASMFSGKEELYRDENPEHCVAKLVDRLKESPEFPHEIGLFLGYPPEDVKGFIENRALHSKCTGCWKVYGDQEEAERIFARYKNCTDCYLRNWQRGTSLEKLTVSLKKMLA